MIWNAYFVRLIPFVLQLTGLGRNVAGVRTEQRSGFPREGFCVKVYSAQRVVDIGVIIKSTVTSIDEMIEVFV